jgi:DNA polymerase-1
MRRVILIDALNMFIRSWTINPSMSTNGNPIGGTVGFLGSIRKVVNDFSPDEVVICWDGAGGSQKRRQIIKSYKEGRKPIRKNYEVAGMDKQSENENKYWQQEILAEMLNEMPTIQFMFAGTEADDVIAFLAKSPKYEGWQKVIISSDKDFIQLLDDETVLYRPIQKKALNKKMVIEEFGISPQNFAIARAMAGDKSDNLPGIGGAGLKTITKRLPFLAEEEEHYIGEICDFCEDADSKASFYGKVTENRELIEANYKVMNLVPPSISVQDAQKINYAIDNFVPELNATGLRKMSIQHGFGSFSWDYYFASLNGVIKRRKPVDG